MARLSPRRRGSATRSSRSASRAAIACFCSSTTARLSRRVLRRRPCRARARAREPALAARSRSLLSRRYGSARRRSSTTASRSAIRRGEVRGTPLRHGNHRRRSCAPWARPESTCCDASRWLAEFPTDARVREHAPRRHGLLDVLARARRGARRASCICNTTWPTPPRATPSACSASAPTTSASRAEDLLRLRLRELRDLPLRGRRVRGAPRRSPGARGRVRRGRPFPSDTLLRSADALQRADCASTPPPTADFSSVRLCLSAAEPLSNELFESWKQRFGHEIVEGLGSTEMLHIFLSNKPRAKRSVPPAVACRATRSARLAGGRAVAARRGRRARGARSFQRALLLEACG